MARGNVPLVALNRGRISRYGLARTDLDRTRLSAEVMTNWMPRTLGSMMVRPGLGYIGTTNGNNPAVHIPFVYRNDDTALIEITDGVMRVRIDDEIVTRTSVSTAVTNGTFQSDVTSWTDIDETGAESGWETGGYLYLKGTRYSAAKRRQSVSLGGADSGKEHGVKIIINRGVATLKIGSSVGASDLLLAEDLKRGVYSFAFTPTGTFDIEISGRTEFKTLIDSIAIESSGDMTITVPWTASDVRDDDGRTTLRWDQSGDVVFVAANGKQQRRIERRAARSWGVVAYEPEDGPFRNPNTTSTRLTPSARSGDVTIEADHPVFKSGHVGGLFRITSIGQDVSVAVTGGNQWSDSIRVSGVDDTRKFDIVVTSAGSTTTTLRVQRSVGEEGSWSNVSGLSWSSTIATTHDDGLDNQIVFYRIGSGSTDYTSGTGAAELSYAAGGLTGVGRVTAFTGSTAVSASVLKNFGSTDATETWEEGEWSDYRGWPSSVVLHEGRLTWAGKAKMQLSVADAYEGFDPDTEGDSAPINRSIGSGPVDIIEWLVSLGRLVIGAQGREMQAKTSSLEEPLTPSNFTLRDISTQGSARVQAVKIDRRALFVQAGGTRLMETGYSGDSLDYETADRTLLVPEAGEPGIVRLAVQRQPDTRVHCVRSDGTAGVLVSDPAENVVCWLDIETDGEIEEAIVLPGSVEDSVYYVVKRTINGETVRYLEKWALESEARGGATNKMADAFRVFNSAVATTTVTGSTHLEGETVCAWGSANGGIDLGSTFVPTSGSFTVGTASTTIIYGLPYTAIFKSAKLAYLAQTGTALTQKKNVNHIGIVGADLHARGLRFGQSTSDMNDLPSVEGMQRVSTNTVHASYDRETIPFPGRWDTDSRVVLVGQSPRPATVLGMIIQMETKDKV